MMRFLLPLLVLFSSDVLAAEWRGADGPFSALIVLSDKPQDIYDAWFKGPPNGVKLKELVSVAPGTSVEAIIIFSGCAPDSKGQCQVTGDWIVTSLSGAEVGKTNDSPIWINRPAPVAGQLQIGENGLAIKTVLGFDGYVFSVKVRDNVSGKSVVLTQKVNVVGT